MEIVIPLWLITHIVIFIVGSVLGAFGMWIKINLEFEEAIRRAFGWG